MQVEKSDTESRIFESARLLFNERGYAGMTLRQIAKEAGIEAQSVYNYVPSKQVLLERLVRRGTGELHNSVLAAIASAEQTPGAQLEAAVKAHVVHYLCSANVVIHFRESLIHFDEERRDSLVAMFKAYEQLYKNIIRQGVASGDFRPVDVTPTTYVILGMGDSTTNWWRPSGRLDAETVGQLLAELAVQMVARTVSSALPIAQEKTALLTI